MSKRIINGKLYHFGPRGLYNGLILLGDDESRSYWDHITGDCVHGSMKGKRMQAKGLFPPGFRKTMSAVDTRLPEMTSGLGVSTERVHIDESKKGNYSCIIIVNGNQLL